MKVEMGSQTEKWTKCFQEFTRALFQEIPFAKWSWPWHFQSWSLEGHCPALFTTRLHWWGNLTTAFKMGFSPDVIRWTIFVGRFGQAKVARMCLSFTKVFHVSHAKMVVSGKWCLEDPHPHSQDSSDWGFFFSQISGDASCDFSCVAIFSMRRTTIYKPPPKKTHTEAGARSWPIQPTIQPTASHPRWKLSAAAMITSTCGFVPGQVVTTQGGRPRVTGTRGVDVEMGSTFVQGAKW